MSIPKIAQKIKSMAGQPRGKDVLSVLLILAISGLSFYFGQQSTIKNSSSQVTILGAENDMPLAKNTSTGQYQAQAFQNTITNTVDVDTYAKGNYLASSRGKKYYPVDCPAANNIKQTNRIYFKTAGDAESKGYTLSSSCN